MALAIKTLNLGLHLKDGLHLNESEDIALFIQ